MSSEYTLRNLSDRLLSLSQATPKNTLISIFLYFIIWFWLCSQNCEKRPLASSCLPVCPSVLPSFRMEQLGFKLTDFYEIWYLWIFWKSVQKIQVSLVSNENKRYFTWWPIYVLIQSRSILLRMRNVSGKSCKGNQNAHSVIRNFRKSCRLWDVEKYCTAEQATDDNMAHAHCMLDT